MLKLPCDLVPLFDFLTIEECPGGFSLTVWHQSEHYKEVVLSYEDADKLAQYIQGNDAVRTKLDNCYDPEGEK